MFPLKLPVSYALPISFSSFAPLAVVATLEKN